ncbi:hypothetical protein BU23DRAFT_548430 [Bimuria novae-zelandiae CBS 107.79]|uniref:Uncharacterized protein n=1 Tax=Bimuria novae-zelandiae CBS 107.79 TaxID=1447943 RepID=A0A6A5VTM4_9PLEO|nr:hypothetical protein BU23DRAFT_548430 [Bimuria novae-zelandiae CBS 107.79]
MLSERPQEDFLIACQAHHPNYAATCLDQVYEHEMNGTNPPSLPTYVEKMTKYTRRAASTAEVGTLSTSVAELGIAKPCICGLSHALHDCYILNPNHLSRPKDWTLPPIRVRKVKQARKDLKIDNSLLPYSQTSLVINLIDKGQSSPTR